MSKWGEVEFKKAVDSVYDILWEMYLKNIE